MPSTKEMVQDFMKANPELKELNQALQAILEAHEKA